MLKLMTPFKTVCAVIFGFILTLTLSPIALAVDPVRTLKVGAYDNKPKVYQTTENQAAGIFPDILNFIAERENWQLEYVFGTWEEGLSRLEKGEIDIMVDVALSEDRQQKYDFTNETVLNSWGVIYVHKDGNIDSFSDLEGKKIAILKSSIYLEGPTAIDQYLKAFGYNIIFVETDEYEQVFTLLNQKVVDAAVVSRIFGLTNINRYPNLRATDIFFSPTELRFALTKNGPHNPYLVEKIDFWVRRLRDGYLGYYDDTLKKHGLIEPIKQELVPSWAVPAGLGAIATLLFITATDYFLKLPSKRRSKR